MSAFISFIHLMAVHGNVQKEAQLEIDAWRGACDRDDRDRNELPTFEELDKFPYLSAILKEVLRYATVGPLGESFDACLVLWLIHLYGSTAAQSKRG